MRAGTAAAPPTILVLLIILNIMPSALCTLCDRAIQLCSTVDTQIFAPPLPHIMTMVFTHLQWTMTGPSWVSGCWFIT